MPAYIITVLYLTQSLWAYNSWRTSTLWRSIVDDMAWMTDYLLCAGLCYNGAMTTLQPATAPDMIVQQIWANICHVVQYSWYEMCIHSIPIMLRDHTLSSWEHIQNFCVRCGHTVIPSYIFTFWCMRLPVMDWWWHTDYHETDERA